MTDVKRGNPDDSNLCGNVRCGQYKNCLLDQPRNGATKGHGLHYIAYALVTDKVEKQHAKQDVALCLTFVEGMQDRMLSGRAAVDAGREGAEYIRILTGAKTYIAGEVMGFNARNEIVNPIPDRVEDLKRAGKKVNLDDRTGATRWEMVRYERPVPDYNAPSMSNSEYSEEIKRAEKEYSLKEMQDEDRRFSERGIERPKRGRKPQPAVDLELESDDFEKVGDDGEAA